MRRIEKIQFAVLIALLGIMMMACSNKVHASAKQYSSSYGYETLTKEQKKAYKAIVALAEDFHNSSDNAKEYTTSEGTEYITQLIDLTHCNIYIEDMAKIMFAIDADHPMLFWYKGTVYSTSSKKHYGSASNKQVLKVALTMYPEYKNGEVRTKALAEIKNALAVYEKKIIALKKEKASDIEIERYIHDSIILNTEYGTKSVDGKSYGNAVHTVQGVFALETAVCEGYAKAFQLLCNYAGIESIYAIGYAEGISHAWNLVKIEGKWYNVDVTWDDLGAEAMDGSLGISYQYFNSPNSRFMVSHEYSKDFPEMYKLPNVAESLKATYYKYYDFTVTNKELATDAAFREFLQLAMTKSEQLGEYIVRILVKDELAAKFESRFAKNKDRIIKTLSKNSIAYRFDELCPAEEIVNIREEFSVVYNVVFHKMETSLIASAIHFDTPGYKVTNYYGRSKKTITGKTTCKYKNGTLYVYKEEDKIAQLQAETNTLTVSAISDKTYRNKYYTPKPVVKLKGRRLVLNEDYVLSYKNNINAGQASVIITGIGKYSGTKTVTFQIKKRTIRSVEYSKIANVTYSGNAKKPKPVLTLNGKKLVLGKDYTLSYSNNRQIGKAKVTITAKGKNYTGTKTLTFNILPQKVKNIKVKIKNNSIKISWTKVAGVTGYEIYYSDSDDGEYKKIARTSKNYIILSENGKYNGSFIIRAYKKSKKYKYYSQKSKIVRII